MTSKNPIIHTKIGVGRNWTNTTGAVAQTGWNSQLSLFSNTHVFDTLLPALDNTPSTQLKCDWSATVVRRVEGSSVHEESLVMDRDGVAKLGLVFTGNFLGNIYS